MKNLNEREEAWAKAVGGVLGIVAGWRAFRQLRGPIRWVWAWVFVSNGLETCRRVGSLVGYELARKDVETGDAANVTAEQAEKQAWLDSLDDLAPLPTEDPWDKFHSGLFSWQGPV